MTPEVLARLHAAAFTTPRPWTVAEFTTLLEDPHTFLVPHTHAFAMGRVIADEAELLTIATDPVHRRQGLGRACLEGFDRTARNKGAASAYLEVSADNHAAITLYSNAGWQRTGLRKNYYVAPDGTRQDAQIMGKSLA